MDDMKIEDQIFYFKEGVVGDVENERSIAIRIIDALQDENRHMKESLCTMPKCEHIDKLEEKNRRYMEALELVVSMTKYSSHRCNICEHIRKRLQEALNTGGQYGYNYK
jgi:hypothetical protein